MILLATAAAIFAFMVQLGCACAWAARWIYRDGNLYEKWYGMFIAWGLAAGIVLWTFCAIISTFLFIGWISEVI